jgi:interferon-induced transmembrane protein
MRCPRCGYVNPGESIRCGNCGEPLSGWAGLRALGTRLPGTAAGSRGAPPPGPIAPSSPAASGEVPTYLVPAALAAVVSFPFGLVALAFAAVVKAKLAAGDVAGAREFSRRARLFFWLSIAVGAVTWGPAIWRLLLDLVERLS